MKHTGPMSVRRILPRAGLALAVAAVGQLVLMPSAASAAGNLTVSTTADIAASAGSCGNSNTTPPTPLSLREATCIANNLGGAVNISIPAGTYNLANGEIQPGIAAGSNISLIGAGAASTIINAGGNSRVIDLDKNLTGGISTTISGLTVTGGADSTFGGAGIIGGSANSGTADSLSLNNVIITGNAANGADMTVSNKGGGGLQFYGGQLSITNSTISNNTSGSSYGSGVAYGAQGAASPEGLTVTNTTFSGNATANTHGDTGTADGGALAVFGGGAGANYNVSNSRFVNNTSTSVGGSGPAYGGAIWSQSGNLTVTQTTFTGNSVSGGSSPNGGAVEVTSGNGTLHYDRFVGNIAPTGSAVHGATSVDAADNWFGCNAGPGGAGCDTVAGTVGVTPRLVLTATASPATVVSPNGTSTITAAFTTDNLGATVGGANLHAFDTLPATFSDPPGDATVTLAAGSHTAAFSGGVASIDYHSGTTTVGADPDNITFDNATVSAVITVDQAPAITSANSAHFNVGSAGSFTVTSTGFPTAALTETGALPAGVTFVDNGDGTATLAGTATGPGGTFPLTITANNGVSPNATQTLTVTVGQPPAFTSPATATYTAGTAGSFTVTTSGIPTVSSITETGSLPTGLTFTDNGNGTATLAGTPAAGSGGTYPVTLTATNGVAPNATQTLSIQVNQAPAITTNPSDQTVNPGTSVTFTAAASGVPTPTVQWQRSTNGGASFTNIAGATSTSYTFTTAAGDNGNLYRAVFTNVVSTATTTAATLNVGTAPAFTSADHTTFAVGTAGNFAISTSGVPSATLSRTGAQFPAWLTLNDNGTGSGSLTGTPPVGSGGTYTFTLKAANGFSPSASQIFTLTVDESPTITSTNHATFVAGSAGTFAVTTAGGFPAPPALTRTGALPSGVTFTDNGDGTATLAGTPAASAGGTYPLTITATATGGVAAPTTQSFTLTVNAPPTITSSDHATFAQGAAGTFTVTTAGAFPAPPGLTKSGTLPGGVTFTDNGDGTATLAGTPAFGSHGVYTITITASNGIAPNATQTFTLTVSAPPTITSTNHATFVVGAAAGFTITTAPGQPTGTTITETGTLPPGVTFTDNGNGTATLGGTPTTGGTYTFTITASNGVAPDPTQTFTATVNQPPTITSADHATFTVGTNGTFTVTTTAGTPPTTGITEVGTLPAGVSFNDNSDGTATLTGVPAVGSGGTYSLTITASNGVAPIPTQAFTLTVNEAPKITSANHATFSLGAAGSFTVTTTGGFPTPPALTETGTRPAGVTFTDNGDGTATLAGTPTVGGVYPLTIKASNGVAPDATQAFTLTVNSTPAITSADHTTFAVGAAGTFTVTTTAGTPPATTLSDGSATLPSGVSFTDNGDGTATLAGTPAAGTGGTYSLTITASNGVPPDATQTFTLTVTDVPAFSSANSTAFTVGTAGNFGITTTPGYPTATALTETGALPAGVSFTDNGDGTATLTGTPAAGSGGTYPLTLTATNTAGHSDQAFTLTVRESPVITSANNATFTAGLAGTFTVTTAGGFPTPPALTETGTLPTGVTFHDNGDGTATLAGTATAGGVYPLTIKASNAVTTDATQSFTLTVNGPPSITSAASMTFVAGVPGTFSVTTRAGVPATPIHLTETGALPAGVTFHDNGDGTATLAGTATAIHNYALTITASNGINPDATQSFTLKIVQAVTVTLPHTRPASNGVLHGVPPITVVGQVLHVSGSGYAAGAPITIGVYSSPVVLGHATSTASGTFTATIRVPNSLGVHTFVAAGIGANGQPRYLEATSLIIALPVHHGGGGSGVDAASGSLANTGPDTDPRTTAGFALAAILAGFMLMAGTRRRRRRGEY
ncbi:MAG: putative Ig domain-containing protein [Actinomycetota bacterium]|nr:putative Ig domain-containing protein [Actinomycetota bacterium]MDQ2956682.1 putative Ig domain-containing protein [Actinomycetota bacterium]